MNIQSFFSKNKGKLNFITFFSSNFIIVITSFALLPIFTRYMSTKELGVFSLFLTFYRIFLNIIEFGSASILSSKFFKYEKHDQNKLLTGLVYFSILIFIVVLIVVICFGNFIVLHFRVDLKILYFSLLVGFFDHIFQFFLKKIQLEQNAVLYSLLSIFKSVSISILGLFFVIKLNLPELGRIYSWSIITFVLSLFVILLNRSRLIKIDLKYIFENFKSGLNILFSNFSGIIISVSDVLFISSFISLEVTGIYSIGLKLGSIISMFDAAFSLAWVGYFYKNVSENSKKVLKYQKLYFISLFIVLFGQTVLSFVFFKYFLEEALFDGYYISILTGIGFLIGSVRGIKSNYLIYYERFDFLRNISIIQMLMNIILNYFLIKSFSMYGASVARIISFLIGLLLINYYINKELKGNNKVIR